MIVSPLYSYIELEFKFSVRMANSIGLASLAALLYTYINRNTD